MAADLCEIHTMRSLGILGLGLFLAQFAAADDTPPFEWSPARSLVWEDFLGPVPGRADENRVAATAASIAWSYRYRLEWSRARCNYRIEAIETTALFHPDDSWVRDGYRIDSVLVHEQGHFDIAQIFRNRFERDTREFIDVSRTCSGRNENAASRNVEDEITELVGSAFDEVWAEYRRQQEAYDGETRHGIDSDAQTIWTDRLSDLLKDSGSP